MRTCKRPILKEADSTRDELDLNLLSLHLVYPFHNQVTGSLVLSSKGKYPVNLLLIKNQQSVLLALKRFVLCFAHPKKIGLPPAITVLPSCTAFSCLIAFFITNSTSFEKKMLKPIVNSLLYICPTNVAIFFVFF